MTVDFPADFDPGSMPAIIIDMGEQVLMRFTGLNSEDRCLASSDYSVQGFETRFAVARKSIADLVACCTGENRDRFEAELVRFRGTRSGAC